MSSLNWGRGAEWGLLVGVGTRWGGSWQEEMDEMDLVTLRSL